jgi:peptide/nickel transport system permease protein
MLNYIIRRLFQAIPVLFVSAVIVFVLMRLTPGDPVRTILGESATEEQYLALRHEMGLDQPLPIQFLGWLANIARGDLGASYINKIPVRDLIAQRAAATAQLAGAGLLLTVLIALPLGILSALTAGKRLDNLLSAVTSLGISVPNFWIGILAILFFAVTLGWLPPGGYASLDSSPDAFKFLVLPAMTICINSTAVLTRFVRVSMLDVLHEHYIRTAHAKGLPVPTVVIKHAFLNALIPVITILGIQVGRMFGGSVIVESVFAWPGIGRLLVTAINTRDYPIVQAVLLIMAFFFTLVNLATDLLYGVVDPRVRLERR